MASELKTNDTDKGLQSGGSDSYGAGASDGSGGGSQVIPSDEIATMNDARQIFKSAVNSVLPKEMVDKHLVMDSIGDVMTIQDKSYHLHGNVYVVGFGKAVLGMARAVDDLIGRHIVRGVVSVPQGTGREFRNAGKTDMLLSPASSIQVREGAANNMPDKAAHDAALEIADLAGSLGEGDLLLVLISGGGSALLPAPALPITLSDMLSVTGQMSRGGATISQLNTVRKQLDFLKGGGLATLASPAQVVSLILSDIVGDPIDLIASGPTVTDTSKPEDCLAIFSLLHIVDTIPKTVMDFLREKSEPLQNGGTSGFLNGAKMSSGQRIEMNLVENMIIGSNKIACDRACQESEVLGYHPFVLSTQLEGEASHVGKMFAHLGVFIAGHLKLLDVGKPRVDINVEKVRELLISQFELSDSLIDGVVRHVEKSKMASSGVCIVAGGETTVNVKGTGRGGRNQEMVTSAGLELNKVLRETSDDLMDGPTTPRIVFLSAGTDGQDGPTSAAGGVVGSTFVEMAYQAGFDPVQYLDNNDSFTLLENCAQGFGLVCTGLTGTNVMDIHVLLIRHDTCVL